MMPVKSYDRSVQRWLRRVAATAAAVVGLVAVGVFQGAAAQAAPSELHVDAYLVESKYHGIGVDIKALDTDLVAELDQVRVITHRTVGGDVVKVSKGTNVVSTLKAGSAVTAPIVIQQGSYDEAGSTSWVQPDAVWTAETIPTTLTVELVDAEGDVLLTRTVDAPTDSRGLTLDDVLPAPAAFTNPTATFHNAADYKGIAVDVRVRDLTDAESISVRVDREGASPVVKSSKPALLAVVNTGKTVSVTAPIVIRPGTHNEAASGSWFYPGAVWTPTTVPTSVTITIERAYGADLVTTLPIKGSIEGIMPEASEPVVIDVPTDRPFEVEVPDGVTDVAVKVGTPVEGAVTVPVQVTVKSSAGTDLVIPAGTTVKATGDANWDGVIKAPTIKEGVTVPSTSTSTATVALAVEVGSDTARLEFDTPVKLVLPGQAGKKAGFIQAGVFEEIDTMCPSAAPALTSGACWINDGEDLVIWTTHFTTFVAYEAEPVEELATIAVTSIAATGSSGFEAWLMSAGALMLLGGGMTVVARRRRRSTTPSS